MIKIVNGIKCHSRAYTLPKSKGQYYYWFECNYCGNGFISFQKLYNGKVKSCGCATKLLISQSAVGRAPPNKLSDLEAISRKVLAASTKHNIKAEITKEEVKDLISKECFYCKEEPKKVRTIGQGKWRRPAPPTNGIDRYDNSLGYITGNCVSCCWRCNFMKSDMHGDTFIELCKLISKNHSIRKE